MSSLMGTCTVAPNPAHTATRNTSAMVPHAGCRHSYSMTVRQASVVLPLLLPAASLAQAVFEKDGNIFFTDASRHMI